jgi:hypothetical protein
MVRLTGLQLLNISLPYDSAYLSINNAALLSPSKILPRINANQVLLDTSVDDISKAVETYQLDTLGHVNFGLSYRYSLRRLTDSSALLFHFDIFEAWSDLPDPALTVKLDDVRQKVLEVVLLQRPLHSAGDMSNAYEIVRAGLVPRPSSSSKAKLHTMHYHDWDDHGEKGTPSHLVSKASDSFVEYIASGMWSLFIFIMALIALFVLLCLFCIFGCGLGQDEYESAQHGKRRSSGKGSRNDVERGKGKFLSAEELGIRGGRVVGVGKAD